MSVVVLHPAAVDAAALRTRARRGAAVAMVAVGLAVAVALAGCDSGRSLDRPAGSAVWVEPASAELQATELQQLEAVGVGELFVEVAELQWSAGRPAVVASPSVAPARRARATLVLRGVWPPNEVDDSAADTVVAELGKLVAAADGRRLIPVGVHLDLAFIGPLEGFAAFVDELRDGLSDQLLLSVSLPLRFLDAPEVEEIADASNFFVAFLYGQRPREREDPASWDFRNVEQAARRLDALGEPFLLGAVTLGHVTYGAGEGMQRTTRGSLAELVWSRSLKLEHGFTLEGIDRQVYELQAQAPVTIGDATLRTGDPVRVLSSSTPHVEELARLVESWGLEEYRGLLFYRVPGEGEAFSLTVANLVGALSPEPALPELEVTVTAVVTGRTSAELTVVVANTSAEITEVAFIDHNFLSVSVDGGVVGDVDLGDFYRFDLWGLDRSGELVQSLRNPVRVRLFCPMLGAGDERVSGPIGIRFPRGAAPSVSVEGSFLAPYGRMASVAETFSWEVMTAVPEEGEGVDGDDAGEGDEEGRAEGGSQ